MGNRVYIGVITNEKYEKIISLKSNKEIKKFINFSLGRKEDYDDGCDDYIFYSDVLEKKIEISDSIIIDTSNKEDLFKRGNFNIINEDDVKEIIKQHDSINKEYLKELITPYIDVNSFLKFEKVIDNEEKNNLYNLVNYFYKICVSYGAISFFNNDVNNEKSSLIIDKKNPFLNSSDLYLFDIFNLLSFYKSIDFTKNKVILTNW